MTPGSSQERTDQNDRDQAETTTEYFILSLQQQGKKLQTEEEFKMVFNLSIIIKRST